MTQIYFIYGNQTLEIEEKTKELIDTLIPKSEQENAVFSFDAGDFFASRQGKEKILLNDFKNTCETVSFFSPKIVVHLKNLQKIPSRKSPTESIEKSLQGMNLVKIEIEEDSVWFDRDTLSESIKTHHHVTARQIVQEILHLGGKSFYLKLNPAWVDRLIYQQKGKHQEAIQIHDYLTGKLKGEISFKLPEGEITLDNQNSSGIVSLLKEFLENPPDQVEFIYSANIRHTRELNRELSDLLKKKAKEIKTTIAYDDFMPTSWVIERAQKKNLTFDHTTADLLIEIAGSEFSVLDMELSKLAILLPHDLMITPEILLKSTSHSKRFSIFRVANFLIQKDLNNTLKCLEFILKDHPADAVSIFGLIAAQFRRLAKISWMLENGLAEKIIIERLKINQWVARQSVSYARNFTMRELENIVIHLAKSDLQIKYYAKDALMILDNICFQICQGSFQQVAHIDRHWLP